MKLAIYTFFVWCLSGFVMYYFICPQFDSRRQDVQAAVSILHGLFAEYEAECKPDTIISPPYWPDDMDWRLPDSVIAGIELRRDTFYVRQAEPTFKGFVEYLERKYPE